MWQCDGRQRRRPQCAEQRRRLRERKGRRRQRRRHSASKKSNRRSNVDILSWRRGANRILQKHKRVHRWLLRRLRKWPCCRVAPRIAKHDWLPQRRLSRLRPTPVKLPKHKQPSRSSKKKCKSSRTRLRGQPRQPKPPNWRRRCYGRWRSSRRRPPPSWRPRHSGKRSEAQQAPPPPRPQQPRPPQSEACSLAFARNSAESD
mmetsp:Transcript_12762/g.27420  ORF Transcript_12762/g.27420 Transcript_12762/m.27420 type:complete len:202 (-) Transcript_12762:32-637(-)